MAFRILVHDTIIYKGKKLEAGRLIRASLDSWPTLQKQYGEKVSFWDGWPDVLTKPLQVKPKVKEKKIVLPNDLEAESWEKLYKEEI